MLHGIFSRIEKENDISLNVSHIDFLALLTSGVHDIHPETEIYVTMLPLYQLPVERLISPD